MPSRRNAAAFVGRLRFRGPRNRNLTTMLAARIGGAAAVVWAVASVTFFAVRAVPGDPVLALLGGPGSNATEEAVAQARADHGLDLPLWQQYLQFLGALARGDLGTSYDLRRPVAEVIGEQLPATLLLTLAALALAWLLALVAAWWSLRAGPVAWGIASLLEAIAAVLPQFWIASILIATVAVGLGVPISARAGGAISLVLPAVSLAIPLAGFLGQVMRERMLDALEQPFVAAARARGISESRVFFRHVLRHAAIPAVSITGWAFGTLISGAVVVETIFARQGLGRTLLDAVTARDVPLVCGVIIVVALAYVVVTLVTELLDQLVDPRLASAGGGRAAAKGTPIAPGLSAAAKA